MSTFRRRCGSATSVPLAFCDVEGCSVRERGRNGERLDALKGRLRLQGWSFRIWSDALTATGWVSRPGGAHCPLHASAKWPQVPWSEGAAGYRAADAAWRSEQPTEVSTWCLACGVQTTVGARFCSACLASNATDPAHTAAFLAGCRCRECRQRRAIEPSASARPAWALKVVGGANA